MIHGELALDWTRHTAAKLQQLLEVTLPECGPPGEGVEDNSTDTSKSLPSYGGRAGRSNRECQLLRATVPLVGWLHMVSPCLARE